jgi:hypothetical protein
MEQTTAVEVIKDLTDVFKHRHQFYWATYYKLLFYHLIIAALPYLIFHFIKTYDFLSPGQRYPVYILIMLSWGLCVFNIWLVFRSRNYLQEEDLRLRIVHKAIREVYFKELGVNLYPGLNSSEAKQQCDLHINDNKVLAVTIGGYMEGLFTLFLILASVLASLLFTFLALT